MGITGKKIGDNANDTGYCIFKNVRIPREYMLSAHNKVAPDGTFS
jgi:alkylation response protein AidB-like acyl-CoA dehydrogenase